MKNLNNFNSYSDEKLINTKNKHRFYTDATLQSSLYIRLQLNIHLLEEKTVSTNMIQRSSPTNQTVSLCISKELYDDVCGCQGPRS